MTWGNSGAYLFIPGSSGKLWRVTASIPYDITTLVGGSAVNADLVATTGSALMGAIFSNNGLKAVVLSQTNNSLYSYTLSSAWDVTTMALVGGSSFSLAGQGTVPYAFTASPDGAHVYVIPASNNTVFQYDLATAWNTTTASYSSLSLASGVASALAMEISSDMEKLYIVNTSGSDAARQYSMPTPGSLSGASYDSISFTVGGQSTTTYGITFNDDCDQMYISDSITDTIYMYTGTAA
jgi:hypothetical protein